MQKCTFQELIAENELENVKVRGIPCKFCQYRVDKTTVPKNLFVYEVRHDDTDWSTPVEIANGIRVNFFGTLFCTARMPLNKDGYMMLGYEDFDFLD